MPGLKPPTPCAHLPSGSSNVSTELSSPAAASSDLAVVAPAAATLAEPSGCHHGREVLGEVLAVRHCRVVRLLPAPILIEDGSGEIGGGDTVDVRRGILQHAPAHGQAASTVVGMQPCPEAVVQTGDLDAATNALSPALAISCAAPSAAEEIATFLRQVAAMEPKVATSLAVGTLRLIHLPPPPTKVDMDPFLLLVVDGDCGSSGGNFCFPCPSETLFYAHKQQLIFQVPDGTGISSPNSSTASEASVGQGICAIIFEEHGIDEVLTQLHEHGCRVQWLARREACEAAVCMQIAGTALAGAIRHTGGALGWGIRSAGDIAKRSELLVPEQCEVPAEAREAASVVRGATRAAAKATGKVVDGVATAVGWAAGALNAQLPGCTEQWQEDTKVVGKSSLGAGAEVFQAFQDATALFWKDVADTSAGVIGHKYGTEAGVTARESMHAVGNAFEMKSYVSKKAVGALLVGRSSKEISAAIDGHGKSGAGNETFVGQPAAWIDADDSSVLPTGIPAICMGSPDLTGSSVTSFNERRRDPITGATCSFEEVRKHHPELCDAEIAVFWAEVCVKSVSDFLSAPADVELVAAEVLSAHPPPPRPPPPPPPQPPLPSQQELPAPVSDATWTSLGPLETMEIVDCDAAFSGAS